MSQSVELQNIYHSPGYHEGHLEAEPRKIEGKWYQPFQPANHETVYVLQLHPFYRFVCGVLLGLFGLLLTYKGSKHLDSECGNGFISFVMVMGIYLLCSATMNLVIAVVRHNQTKSRGGPDSSAAGWQQGEPIPPPWWLLVVDWILNTICLFIMCGVFNTWFWIYGNTDPACPESVKSVSLYLVIFFFISLGLICCCVVTLAFHVSGPAYVYQLDNGEHLDLSLPVFLRKKNYDAFGMNMSGGEMIVDRLY